MNCSRSIYFKKYNLVFNKWQNQDLTLKNIEHCLCEFKKCIFLHVPRSPCEDMDARKGKTKRAKLLSQEGKDSDVQFSFKVIRVGRKTQ